MRNLVATALAGLAMMRTSALAGAAVLGMLAFGASTPALAGAIIYELDTEFSGAAPDGTAPWITATFTDKAVGVVNVMIELTNLTDPESLERIAFNLDPSFNAASLGVVFVDISSVSGGSISLGTNIFEADSAGFFDVLFSFSAGDFGPGEWISVDFSLLGLTASSFAFVSGTGFYVAAKVNGTGSDDQGISWITDDARAEIPEPGTLAIFGLGLLGMGLSRRRRAA